MSTPTKAQLSKSLDDAHDALKRHLACWLAPGDAARVRTKAAHFIRRNLEMARARRSEARAALFLAA